MQVPTDHRSRRLTVTLPPGMLERLVELAEVQLRRPADQAAILIVDGLELAGVYDRTPAKRPSIDVPPATRDARP